MEPDSHMVGKWRRVWRGHIQVGFQVTPLAIIRVPVALHLALGLVAPDILQGREPEAMHLVGSFKLWVV
jgi:hypothetical protein